VLRALAARVRAGSQPGARSDGLRIALAIEGGAMRGIISAGMALALHEMGLVQAFDAVYGASAGSITGAWLLSRPEGLRGWAEPAYARALIRPSAMLRGRPVADIRALIEELYLTTYPMDFAAVLANPVELHPLATDTATGQSTDLRPFIGNPAELRLALRASAAMPLLAGPPVELAGRRFYDAGVSESIPYRTALAQGVTHLLILRSRRDPRPSHDAPSPHAVHSPQAPHSPQDAGSLHASRSPQDAGSLHASRSPQDADSPPTSRFPQDAGSLHASRSTQDADSPPTFRSTRDVRPAPDARSPYDGHRPSFSARLLARTTLRRESPALRAAFLARESRLAADDQVLAEYEAASLVPPATSASARPPAVFSIRPAPDSPEVSRLATNGALLQAALEAGRSAAHSALRACALSP
jgi:predicted patatin/cPLA2 family phospholipase